MIKVRNLEVRRSGRIICKVAQFDMEAGDHCWIWGQNGSGKSTFVRALAGLESHQAGSIAKSVAPNDCVYLSQDPFLFRGSLLHNLHYGLRGRGLERAKRNHLVESMIETLHLQDLTDSNLRCVSGGEKQRIALARALVLQPKILLLDEPFSELDETHTKRVRSLLAENTGITVILTSPNPPPSEWQENSFEMEKP